MNEIAKLVAKLRDTFDSGHTRPHAWRKQQLKHIRRAIHNLGDFPLPESFFEMNEFDW